MKWKSLQQKIIDLQGPAYQKEIEQGKKIPVECDFTDELESISVLKYPVSITFGDTTETAQKTEGFIKDFVIRDKVELMLMSDGTEIRLDRIRKISNL